MAQAPAKADPKNASAKGPFPPDERFWKRYSPHHEFPLSLVIAIGLHVAALVVMVAVWAVSSLDSPAAPPRMEVVEIEGGSPALDGLGTGDTLKGSGDKDKENVGEASGDKLRPPRPNETKIAAALKDPLKGPELKFPGAGNEVPDEGDDPFAGLDQATKQATEDIIKATKPPAPPAGTKNKGTKPGGKYVGVGGPKGKGGTGRGDRTGPGRGKSPYGQVLTDQRKRQMRWQILASPIGKIHLDKLKALNVTLVMPTRDPRLFTVFDLERQPIAPKTTTRLEEHADKVWWTNRDPVEVQGLARELGLREMPQCFVIFLPKGLEDRMVQLEEQYQGAREDQIEKTIWDVPLRNGRYASEPQVVRQILRGQR
jgi:hypothetical protein